MTDLPTTPLPLPAHGTLPPAWDDAATRRSVNQSLWVALLLVVVALAAATGCVAVVQLGYLSEVWGLWVLVAAGGLGGGALAGGVTMLILWRRTRDFLRDGPWVPGQLALGDDKDAELTFGSSFRRIRMEVRTAALGDPGEEFPVDVRVDGDRMLITMPPSRRVLRATNDPDTTN